jgi:hypothetical protein
VPDWASLRCSGRSGFNAHQPKPQRFAHPLHCAHVLLKGPDGPPRVAERSLVAGAVLLQRLGVEVFYPLVLLGLETGKQFLEVMGLFAVGGGHRQAISASHGYTLTKGKSMVNSKNRW